MSVEVGAQVRARVARRIRLASAAGALLGGLPIPTSGILTALQAWLVQSIGRAHGRAPTRGDALALGAPVAARTAGVALWRKLAQRLPSPLVGMVAGAAIGGGLTWAVGRAAQEYFEAQVTSR